MWSNVIVNSGNGRRHRLTSWTSDESSSSEKSASVEEEGDDEDENRESDNVNSEIPCMRYKHASCLVTNTSSPAHQYNQHSNSSSSSESTTHLYLYGGKAGQRASRPLRDLWCLTLKTATWSHVKPCDNNVDQWPPGLQEHTLVHHGQSLYVFGGEIVVTDEAGSSSTARNIPFWIFHIPTRTWRRWTPPMGQPTTTIDATKSQSSKIKKGNANSNQNKKGVTVPMGRRSHTCLVYNDYMILYGGFRDLKGSLGDLWIFHFDTSSWHQLKTTSSLRSSSSSSTWSRWSHLVLSTLGGSPVDSSAPPPRHNHSAALHHNKMWVFGGMTNLQVRTDLWNLNLDTQQWTQVKFRAGVTSPPPCLFGHTVASKALGSIIVIGNLEDGTGAHQEFWRFDLVSETWERLQFHGEIYPKGQRLAPSVVMLPAIVKKVRVCPHCDSDSSYDDSPVKPQSGLLGDDSSSPGSSVSMDGYPRKFSGGSVDKDKEGGAMTYWWDYSSTTEVVSTSPSQVTLHPPSEYDEAIHGNPDNDPNMDTRHSNLNNDLDLFDVDFPPIDDGEAHIEQKKSVLKTRRSESAIFVRHKNGNGNGGCQRNGNSVRKSASVRFADEASMAEQEEKEDRGGKKKKPGRHYHIPNSTSDYSSMETVLLKSLSGGDLGRSASAGAATFKSHNKQLLSPDSLQSSGFENPNYMGPHRNSVSGAVTSEAIEMSVFGEEPHPEDFCGCGAGAGAGSGRSRYQVTTPNYMLVLGGLESDMTLTKVPLSMWRLRVTPQLFK